jgi:hypothetical protein
MVRGEEMGLKERVSVDLEVMQIFDTGFGY